MNRCKGCGILLQSVESSLEGYVRENVKEKELCERCFRIQNYNEYKKVNKTNQEFFPILKEIKQSNDLVLLVIDLFHMNQNIKTLTKHCGKNVIFVFTKRDLLPLSVEDEKLKEYVMEWGIDGLDTVIISSIKNKGLDELFDKIKQHQTSKNVYIVGYTNAGKSTLINQLLYHYGMNPCHLTTSMLSSTTLDKIEIPMNETLTILDTPGIIEGGNICDVVELETLKKINPKKEVRPITYQVRGKQYIWVEDICMIRAEDHNLTLFFSNQLKIERYYKNSKKIENLVEQKIRVIKGQDIVILGLGFIKCTKDDVISIYTLPNVSVYARKSLI